MELENLSFHINDYFKIFGSYYFEKIYMKENNSNANALFEQARKIDEKIEEIDAYDKLIGLMVDEKMAIHHDRHESYKLKTIKDWEKEGNLKKGDIEHAEKEYLDAMKKSRINEKYSLKRTLKNTIFPFMQNYLGFSELKSLDDEDINKLNPNDKETVFRILLILKKIQEQENDILSSLKKASLDKKECALGFGEKRSLDKKFDFIRRKLMENLSLEEVILLMDIAVCLDYNRVFLQEILRLLINTIVKNIKETYSYGSSVEFFMRETLFNCFRTQCVKKIVATE